MRNPLGDAIASQISEHISRVTGKAFQIQRQQSIGGGCINQSTQVSDGDRTFFVKSNRVDQLEMFIAEHDALQEMYASQTIRVPQPLCYGTADSAAYIVMEWLPLGGGQSSSAWANMGKQLAAMHRVTSEKGFGWHRDNTIGATPQLNGWFDDWVEFWRDHRMGPQFSMAHAKRGHFPRRDEFMNAIPRLLKGHTPEPALLHGDLWSGNAAITQSGEPTILDPAAYYGDAEADIAMTELFGGFPSSFYQAYESVNPLGAGYPKRKVLYNLYLIVNHFNLFGGSYESQANRMINLLLK